MGHRQNPARKARPGARAILVGPVLVAGLVVAACGSGESATSTPVGSFTGAELRLTAVNIQFDPLELSVPAGVPLRLTLDNQDSGIPHDVRVSADGQVLATSPIVTGPGHAEVSLGPLRAGRYRLVCTIHPNMTAALVVGP